jgi:hypothetical protein
VHWSPLPWPRSRQAVDGGRPRQRARAAIQRCDHHRLSQGPHAASRTSSTCGDGQSWGKSRRCSANPPGEPTERLPRCSCPSHRGQADRAPATAACSPAASTNIATAVAFEEREETVSEAGVTVITVSSPLRHGRTSRSASAVMGGQPPARCRERDKRAVSLSTAPRASVPRLFPRRRDRELGGAAGEAEPASGAAVEHGRGGARQARSRPRGWRAAAGGLGTHEARGRGPGAPIANEMAAGTDSRTIQTTTTVGAPRRRPTPLAVR